MSQAEYRAAIARRPLRYDLSDALDALQAEKAVPDLDDIVAGLMDLGDSYRWHGVILRQALQRQAEGDIIAQLVLVIDKLERGVR